MTEQYRDTEQAEGKIQLALSRLAEEYPFHVKVLEQFRVTSRPEVGTMAVTIAGDDLLLLHNPAFVLETPADELGGVLLHEVHHVVLGHLLADPSEYPDEWARIIAQEVTVNEFVKEPLPAGGITLEGFPALPPLESTRRRYDRLRKSTTRKPIESPRDSNQPHRDGGGSGKPSTEDGQGRRGRGPGGSPDRTEGSQGQRRERGSGSKPASRRKGLQTADDHSVWEEARQDPERARDAIRKTIEQAVLAAGPENVPLELQEAIDGLGIAKQPGNAPGGGRHDLQGGGDGKLDWRHLLRRYVGQVVEVRPVFSRPPRRFPELAGIIPGQRRQATKPKIMAIIDTSGSITPQLLEMINAELVRLAKHFTVTVVECDAVVHRVYDYRPLKEVCGRGGTDLRPPLEAAFLRKHRPDLLIYFTDGFGPAPAKPPMSPLIWCLTPGGHRPATWGRVVEMTTS